MTRFNENESRIFLSKSYPTLRETPTPPKILPLPGSGDAVQQRAKKRISSTQSSYASDQESTLYMASTKNRRQQRVSRQSLSAISNKSILSPDDPEIAYKLARSLSREKLAWKIINREIAEWQNVCQTGRPSWWSPASRGTRRLRSQSSINRDMSTFVTKARPDEIDDFSYPGLYFESEKRGATDNDKEDHPRVHELIFVIAIQLLSACFTLPADQFSSYKPSANLRFDAFGSNYIPDARLISSLRMHTNYRWCPAFGHEARSTSPEYIHQAIYGGGSPRTTPGQDFHSPQVDDSGRSSTKRKKHRARHVTPADSPHQKHWEDDCEKTYPDLASSTLPSWGRNYGDTETVIQSAPVPGRIVKSCPPTPFRMDREIEVHQESLEYPFSTQPGDKKYSERPQSRRQRSSRYDLQPMIRSEPHPVFVQAVRELVVKRWHTFRRRFAYSLSHGCPDPGSTSAGFIEEYTASTWSPLASAPSTPEAVRRRRDARARHDIYSSSVESSPRYNTPTSPSGVSSPAYEDPPPPNTTPTAGESDHLVAAAQAITGSISATPQEPLTTNQPFPVFTPNNTPDAGSEAPTPGTIPRTDAGFFTNTAAGRTGYTSPSFIPRAGSSGRKLRRSMLSEVYTPDDMQETDDMQQSGFEKRHFLEAAGNTLTTQIEESESDESNRSVKRTSLRRRHGSDPESSKFPGSKPPHKLKRRKSSPETSRSLGNAVHAVHGESSRSAKSQPKRAQSAELPKIGMERGYKEELRISMERRRLKRMSSSGTTLYEPSDDGVEVDGVPTGPVRDVWDAWDAGVEWDGEETRRRRRRGRARSFL